MGEHPSFSAWRPVRDPSLKFSGGGPRISRGGHEFFWGALEFPRQGPYRLNTCNHRTSAPMTFTGLAVDVGRIRNLGVAQPRKRVDFVPEDKFALHRTDRVGEFPMPKIFVRLPVQSTTTKMIQWRPRLYSPSSSDTIMPIDGVSSRQLRKKKRPSLQDVEAWLKTR